MPSDKDHFAAAEQHLDAAEAGFEYIDNRALAAGQYALLGIGHALVRIAGALDGIADDVDEIKRQGGDR